MQGPLTCPPVGEYLARAEILNWESPPPTGSRENLSARGPPWVDRGPPAYTETQIAAGPTPETGIRDYGLGRETLFGHRRCSIDRRPCRHPDPRCLRTRRFRTTSFGTSNHPPEAEGVAGRQGAQAAGYIGPAHPAPEHGAAPPHTRGPPTNPRRQGAGHGAEGGDTSPAGALPPLHQGTLGRRKRRAAVASPWHRRRCPHQRLPARHQEPPSLPKPRRALLLAIGQPSTNTP